MIKAIQKTGKQLHLKDLSDITELAQMGGYPTLGALGIEYYYKTYF